MSIEIIITGEKAIGKTFIARTITKALKDAGIECYGNQQDTDIRDIQQYKKYDPIKITTTKGID